MEVAKIGLDDLLVKYGPEALLKCEKIPLSSPVFNEARKREERRQERREQGTPWQNAPVPQGWSLNASGVWANPPEPKSDRTKPEAPELVAGPVRVEAFTRDLVNAGWGAVTLWIDRDGKLHKRAIPATRFHEQGTALAQELAAEGLMIVPGRERKLTAYLGSYPNTIGRVQSVARLGWLDTTDGSLAYVLPGGVIKKGGGEGIVFQPERYSPTSATIRPEGTLEEWQRNVAMLCSGHPFLVFTLAQGFTGPLLKAARLDSGGFHLYGLSSRGKTCAAQVAASVWGCGADPADAPDLAFIRRWNATTNALEGLAAAHSDGLLVLDELGTCTARDFGKAVYDLAGGQGKSALSPQGLRSC